jgi:hypothetical protein
MSQQQHKPKVEAGKIHIREFKIIKGQIDSPEEFIVGGIEGHHAGMELKLAFNLNDNMIKADFFLNVKTKSSNIDEATAVFHLVYIIEIDNLKELTRLEKDNKINLDVTLGNTIASIVHSTSRGVFLTRFQGT